VQRVLTLFHESVFGVKMALGRHFPRAIIFFGPDGAGKSTQTSLLMRYLISHRRHPWRTWIRGRHSVAFVFANLLAKLGYCQIVEVSGGKIRKVFDPRLLPKLRPIWGLIEFVSVLPWIVLRVYLPSVMGYTIVAERYVIDTLVYLGYWLGYDFLKSFLARILWRFIPEDSVIIHLYAETKKLLERSLDDEATPDFICFQQKVYLELARKLGAVSINTSQFDVKETYQQILNVLHTHSKIQ